MKLIKTAGIFLSLAVFVIFTFSCSLFGEDDPYSAVNVKKVSVADLSGNFTGSPVANQQEFEEKILNPLLGTEGRCYPYQVH